VNKVAKAILIALGVILAAGAVAVLGVNLYIQSAAVQAKIRHRISRAVQMPVKIAGVSFMPWYGVRIAGITTQDDALPETGQLLDVASVSARLQLWKLLRHQVVIKELTVDRAKVSWTQNTSGSWRPGSQTQAQEAPSQAPAVTEIPNPPPSGAEPGPEEEPVSKLAPIMIQHFRLRDSSFNLFDKTGQPVAALSGIEIQAPDPSNDHVHGDARISRAEIQGLFSLEDWRTEFNYSPRVLSLFNTSSKVAGGNATGSLNLKIGEADIPFDTDLKFSGVGMERLLADAGTTFVQASGTLSGFLHLQGNLHDSASASGNGRVVLTDGRISKSDLFADFARLLHTDRFQHVDLQEAFVNFHVSGGNILVDQLSLKSPDIAFASQGTVGTAGGNISLKSRITIGSEIARQIPDFLMENFGTEAGTNARYIDFDIGGTINRTETNLQQMIGHNINYKTIRKGADNFLKSWFRRNIAPAPAQAPAATPPAPPAAVTPSPAPTAPPMPTPGSTP
jgi:uncharacterized protein involved in outer membrane biogenesis